MTKNLFGKRPDNTNAKNLKEQYAGEINGLGRI